MNYDVIVIGAGLSGLCAASLLAKRGLTVAVVEHADRPGGSCGSFQREGAVFDQGASMLYGFGEHGFNAHRFLFNCLEEPFAVVKHELLYVVHYRGKTIRFWSDVGQFIEELSAAFPRDADGIRRFYRDMQRLYTHVISETPSYTTPDETNPREALRGLLRHPISYLRFLSYLNISAETLLRRYFSDPELLHFFDKLTSTYCYATVAEAPAILASVMFIDNHVGGSYYPAGSTLLLPGTLEKVIEENSGELLYSRTAVRLLFKDGVPCGVHLHTGEDLYGRQIIYSGTVWNLYGTLLPDGAATPRETAWAAGMVPTYPSVVLYALADRAAIPPDACPIEMLAENPDAIDESEVTVYLTSLDDHTLCAPDRCTLIAVGPSFRRWDPGDPVRYKAQKQEEIWRLLAILCRRFPDLDRHLFHCELATPCTIQRYTMKNDGAVAGPKQMLGQHLLLRQSIRTRWDTLFCCGESTVMGTGTPTVTTSGIAAANAALKRRGLPPYVWRPHMKNYVRVLQPPVEPDWTALFHSPQDAERMALARRCRFCSHPLCCAGSGLDIPGILRRTACGNFTGAERLARISGQPPAEELLRACQERCVQAGEPGGGVEIARIVRSLQGAEP